MDKLFGTVFSQHEGAQLEDEPVDFECLKRFVDTFEYNCGKLEDYSLKFVNHFVHSCETESSSEVETALSRIELICADKFSGEFAQ